MFNVGDIVRVKPPFDMAYSETYEIEFIKDNGICVICEDRDFSPEFLERV